MRGKWEEWRRRKATSHSLPTQCIRFDVGGHKCHRPWPSHCPSPADTCTSLFSHSPACTASPMLGLAVQAHRGRCVWVAAYSSALENQQPTGPGLTLSKAVTITLQATKPSSFSCLKAGMVPAWESHTAAAPQGWCQCTASSHQLWGEPEIYLLGQGWSLKLPFPAWRLKPQHHCKWKLISLASSPLQKDLIKSELKFAIRICNDQDIIFTE